VRNWSWRESAAGEKPWVLVGFYEEEAHRAYRTVRLPSSLEDENMRTAEWGMIRRSRFDHVVDEGARAMSREA